MGLTPSQRRKFSDSKYLPQPIRVDRRVEADDAREVDEGFEEPLPDAGWDRDRIREEVVDGRNPAPRGVSPRRDLDRRRPPGECAEAPVRERIPRAIDQDVDLI